MKFYRVELTDPNGNHGYTWTTTKKAAEKEQREFLKASGAFAHAPIETFDVEPRRPEILKLLKTVASYPDNG